MTDNKHKISIQNVYFSYHDVAKNGATTETEALKDVSINIKPNEIFVLFGPARGGKTTLLRMLNRLSDLTENSHHQGTILFNGQDIFARGTDVTSLRRRISMVFAIPTPLPGSIWENLTYGLKMAGIKNKQLMTERVERSLQQAALWDEVKDRLDSSAFALSGGQKQRLCIARSLALEPEVVVLDNPTSGLDPLSTSMVEDSLYELKERYTIIMVPHSIQQAARIADRAAFLMDGKLIETDTVGKLFSNPTDQRTEDYITGRFG
jgi:phosphate transport system ATP-binding protein